LSSCIPDRAIISFVPTPLQLAGNQAIVGIDCRLTASPGGSLGLLNSVLDLLALVALALIVGLHCGKRGLDTERL
jgi:hypothetical protein